MIEKYLTKTTKNKKRIGRGYGSGKGGHTVGRGSKGQRSRSGYKVPRKGFEGGQMPLSRRLPKLKGFSRGYYDQNTKNLVIGLDDLNDFASGEVVNIDALVKKGFISGKSKDLKVKILGNGEITKKVTIENIPVSKSAEEKIVKAGGKIA